MEDSDIGKYARHPLRTMVTALLAGIMIGAAIWPAKEKAHRRSWQSSLTG